MLYATSAYFNAFQDGGGAGSVNSTLLWRGLLAIFGHVTWTAIVVGAVWRDRGQSRFRLTFGVILAFLIAVTLHGLWDGIPIFGTLIAAVVGLWLIRFFLREAVAREKLSVYAAPPPPPPLALALITYLFHPFRDPVPRPAAPPAGSFSGSWQIAQHAVAAYTPQPAAPQAYTPQPSAAPPYAPPAPRICANGHTTTDPQARFCRICGAPLGG